MRFLIGLIGSIVLIPLFTMADFTGISAFAGMNPRFPCVKYISQLNKSDAPIMAVLYGTFGSSFSCIQKFTDSNLGRPHAVEVHLHNNPCHLNDRCSVGELSRATSWFRFNSYLEARDARMLRLIRLRAVKIRDGLLAASNKDTQVLVSTGLEDTYSTKGWLVVYNILRDVFKDTNFSIVRNPVTNAYHRPADFYELHGLRFSCSAKGIASNDGLSLNLSEARTLGRSTRNCGGKILWLPDLQGFSGEKFFLEPVRRSFRFSLKSIRLWDVFLDTVNKG